MKVALVHDWLVCRGGGERVLLDLHEMFPKAPIYTLVYDAEKAPEWCRECDIRTTHLQNIPGAKSHHRMLLTLMPRAWESLDLSEFDLVISTCSSCCKGVITKPDSLHICYCFSPTRYLWDMYYDYLDNAKFPKSALMPFLLERVRQWDFLAAQRPDYFVSDSDFVGMRVRKYYRRDSTTIYPGTIANPNPVIDEPCDYYLVVSRFVHYKRVDIAIEACNMLGRKLIVIGSSGEEEEKLRSIAGPTVQFITNANDESTQNYYSCAKAFLFPGIEDYGITPVEAMSAGTPVLAYGEGGALETVLDGRTGLLFNEQSVFGLAECIERFENEGVSFTRMGIREYSEAFSRERFKREMLAFIKEKFCEKGICVA